MRRTPWLAALLLALLLPTAAHAAEAQCPLPLTECLMQFQRLRERPWLGVSVELDSVTHQRVIRSVEPGSPAHRAGILPGDVMLRIENQPAAQWFASKAGWRGSDEIPVAVQRYGMERTLTLSAEAIPEERLAKYVGAHMLEGHLAYMRREEHDAEQH